MPAKSTVQYTVRGISPDVDRALRRRAKQRGLSLNQLVVEELSNLTGGRDAWKRRSFDDIKGMWQDDPDFDKVLAEQRKVDRDLWK